MCIKNVESMHITRQCKVPLSIRKYYRDDIICDVVDMELCQLLSERPGTLKLMLPLVVWIKFINL